MVSAFRITARAAVAPKRHHHMRLHDLEFMVEPPAAGIDLARVRLLVDAPLAARLILEVLHRIGDVDRIARDAGDFQRAIEHLAGGSDKGPARQDPPDLQAARRQA